MGFVLAVLRRQWTIESSQWRYKHRHQPVTSCLARNGEKKRTSLHSGCQVLVRRPASLPLEGHPLRTGKARRGRN